MWKSLAVVVLCGGIAAADPKAGSCEAVAKRHAKSVKLTAYTPAACTSKGGAHAPRLLASEGDARPHLECRDPGAKLGIDFTKHALIVTARSPSPAQVGTDVYDDGTVVTFVNRERAPCKGDPRPMPGPRTTVLYRVAAGPRTFVDGSCTVPTTCAK